MNNTFLYYSNQITEILDKLNKTRITVDGAIWFLSNLKNDLYLKNPKLTKKELAYLDRMIAQDISMIEYLEAK